MLSNFMKVQLKNFTLDPYEKSINIYFLKLSNGC